MKIKNIKIKQLERALVGARTWNDWKENIKRLYDNPTEQYLDELFANWKD